MVGMGDRGERGKGMGKGRRGGVTSFEDEDGEVAEDMF